MRSEEIEGTIKEFDLRSEEIKGEIKEFDLTRKLWKVRLEVIEGKIHKRYTKCF